MRSLATAFLLIWSASLQNFVVESKLRGLAVKNETSNVFSKEGTDFQAVSQEKRILQIVDRHLQDILFEECEGSCRKNSQCAGNLVCTQRRAYDPVPGCFGGEQFGADVNFCVPASVLNSYPVTAPALAPRQFTGSGLGLCDGDCDNDSQCKGGLYCFQRSKGDAVPPECPGLSRSSQKDVCVPKNGYVAPGPAPGPVPVSYAPPPISITSTRTSGLGECEGDCDSDSECATGLKCLQRDPNDPVPGCAGVNLAWSTDYCVKSQYVPDDPTPSPVRPPTPSPVQQYDFRGPGLGLCKGDCDDDDDCAGDLICFQRSKGDPIPSECSGSRSNQVDYCVPPDGARISTNTDISESSTPSNRAMRLRLYWEEGYMWQESSKELFYCVTRDYGGSRQTNGKCWYGLETMQCNPEHLYMDKCDRDDRQQFVYEYVNENEAIIKVDGQNRCFQRDGLEIKLKPCNSDLEEQRFFAIRGGFDEYRFEISQKSAVRYCLNQAHHPKPGEVVQMYPCSRVRSPEHSTSYWEWY